MMTSREAAASTETAAGVKQALNAGAATAVETAANAGAATGLEKAGVETAIVVSNFQLSEGIYLIRLKAPSTAKTIKAGQFVHLLIPDLEAHVLRRPISVFYAEVDDGIIDLVYLLVGDGTRKLSRLTPGTEIELIGPLGKGWNPPKDIEQALLVAGGAGLAPLRMLCDSLAGACKVWLVYGAPSKYRIIPLEDLKDVEMTQMTDDGSMGFKGFSTDYAEQLLRSEKIDYIATCGPEIMMQKVANMARQFEVFCEVSLERRMGCGVGACLSCTIPTINGLKRACVDGPVFDAMEVIW